MNRISSHPFSLFETLWINRSLLWVLTKREISAKYKGSLIGGLWALLTPIFMLMVYAFVFGDILNSRWSGGTGSKSEFALILFAGLILFNFFSESLIRAPLTIISNVNYVKKVVFPLELLEWVNISVALFHLIISFIVWIIGYSLLMGAPHLTIFTLPLILIPFLLLTLGICWLFSAIGVFMRDLSQLIGITVTALMFLSPLFFPISLIPERFVKFIQFNPLTIPIQQAREVAFWGNQPDFSLMLKYTLVSLIIMYSGYWVFQKSRRGFADVL